MKFKAFIRPAIAISLALGLGAAAAESEACGPYYITPQWADFFSSDRQGYSAAYFERQENLRLWQEATSPDIPLSDIEQVVYKFSSNRCSDNLFNNDNDNNYDNNRMLAYLNNRRDNEILRFLATAKDLEESRAKMNSPWYYPESDWDSEQGHDLMKILGDCLAYQGTRLKDRYALQAVRAYFAMRTYDKCIAYFDEAFADFPDSNLLKRMAMSYVSGCWSALGDTTRATEYYIRSDRFDPNEGRHVHEFALANPDNPALMAHIQSRSSDSAFFCELVPVAQTILADTKVKNRGDWEFVLAFAAGHYHDDYTSAGRLINRALQHQFSSDDFRDHARAYRALTDAKTDNTSRLLADLQWLEKKTDAAELHADDWLQIMKTIAYTWLPKIWNRGDYATAILLCGCADNFKLARCLHSNYYDSNHIYFTLDELRASETIRNYYDYSALSFGLMNSLTSQQLISAKARMAANTPLYTFLRKYARTDEAYINELIGTIALREENYSLAASYLAKVPESYQRTMNIYKDEGNYLGRDPFTVYPEELPMGNVYLSTPLNAKLNFARRMLEYKRLAAAAPTADERGMARLHYAIGKYNAATKCWALTEYGCGSYIEYGHTDYDEFFESIVGYGRDYSDFDKAGEIFRDETRQAIASMASDEAKAQAEYMLLNLKTVVKHYGTTATAQLIKSSCDRWQQWI